MVLIILPPRIHENVFFLIPLSTSCSSHTVFSVPWTHHARPYLRHLHWLLPPPIVLFWHTCTWFNSAYSGLTLTATSLERASLTSAVKDLPGPTYHMKAYITTRYFLICISRYFLICISICLSIFPFLECISPWGQELYMSFSTLLPVNVE